MKRYKNIMMMELKKFLNLIDALIGPCKSQSIVIGTSGLKEDVH